MKALIFGCSFSQGSYYSSNTSPVYELVDYNVGWWSYVKCLENAIKDIYAMGGTSYLAWSLLYKWYIKDKNYDCCIIQETSESRTSTISYKNLINSLQKYQPNNLTNLAVTSVYDFPLYCSHPFHNERIHKNYKNKLSRQFMQDYYDNYQWNWLQYEMSKKWLISELLKDDIPVYFFSMMENYGVQFGGVDHFGGIELGLENLYYKIGDNYAVPKNEDLIHPHQTEEGNKIIGALVDEALAKYVKE